MAAALNIPRWIASQIFFYFIYLGIIIYNQLDLEYTIVYRQASCRAKQLLQPTWIGWWIVIYINEVMSHDQQFLSPFRLVRVIFTLFIINNSITLQLGLLISSTLFLSLSLCDTLQRKIGKKNLSGTLKKCLG